VAGALVVLGDPSILFIISGSNSKIITSAWQGYLGR